MARNNIAILALALVVACATVGNVGAQPLGPVVGDGKITVTPATVRVGQKLKIGFSDFPEPGTNDQIIVVPGGTPDSVALDTQGAVVGRATLTKYYLQYGLETGPYAPGRYEVRWMTTLYNNESKYEIGARGQFTVTR